jgi:hypothetical protein
MWRLIHKWWIERRRRPIFRTARTSLIQCHRLITMLLLDCAVLSSPDCVPNYVVISNCRKHYMLVTSNHQSKATWSYAQLHRLNKQLSPVLLLLQPITLLTPNDRVCCISLDDQIMEIHITNKLPWRRISSLSLTMCRQLFALLFHSRAPSFIVHAH